MGCHNSKETKPKEQNDSKPNLDLKQDSIPSNSNGNSLKQTSDKQPVQKRVNDVRFNFPDAKVVVGVDFGTTFSGFSFILIPDDDSTPQRVYSYTEWRDQPPRIASAKTPTVINYSISPDGIQQTHWGWTVDSLPHAPHMKRVERCKLLLHERYLSSPTSSPANNQFIPESEANSKKNKELAKNIIFSDLELPPGLEPPRVISDYLRFMSSVIFEQISKLMIQTGSSEPLTKEKMVYCFTVPVFWDAKKLNTMREAIYSAGLIPTVDSRSLLFCPEPVAGLISYIKSPHFQLSVPCSLLILDAGGGTVDLFQCKISASKEISEVTQADGGFFGSSLVDRYFWDFIEENLGKETFNLLWNDPSLRSSKIDIMQRWEGLKREFSENETVWEDTMLGGYKHILLSRDLCRIIPESVLKALPSDGGEIRIFKNDMKRFFNPAVDEIVQMVVKQLDLAGITSENKLDGLCMIGGFCSSPYLRDKLLQHPSIATRIVKVPSIPQPESAVLVGAAWYAFDKGIVTERISNCTLGIRVARLFSEEKDEFNDVFNKDDLPSEWRVYKGFLSFVKKNQSIPAESSFAHPANIHKGKHLATIEILKSDILSELSDADEVGVASVGSFQIDISPWNSTCPEWNGSTFTVSIQFGDMELWVRVIPVLKPGVSVSVERMNKIYLSTTMKVTNILN